MKLELVLKKELLQSGCELAPEDATQRGDGQEESSRGGDPSGTVGCKTASRNHVVYVRMMVKVLSPSVEHAKKPDVGTQMFRVSSPQAGRIQHHQHGAVHQVLRGSDEPRHFLLTQYCGHPPLTLGKRNVIGKDTVA